MLANKHVCSQEAREHKECIDGKVLAACACEGGGTTQHVNNLGKENTEKKNERNASPITNPNKVKMHTLTRKMSKMSKHT